MKTFRLHWLSGSFEDVQGNDFKDAYQKKGYTPMYMLQKLARWEEVTEA